MIQKTTPPEPFGYFRAEPFGWTDCAEEDEGAVPLYDQSAVDSLERERDDLAMIIASDTGTESAVSELQGQRDGLISALREARQRVEIDRAALFQCHLNFSTNTVTDELGLAGLAEYDAAIEAIDAAIDGVQE